MSVVKSKRHDGLLAVITKANELAVYTIKICSNEKSFPKHYRWCITAKIVNVIHHGKPTPNVETRTT